MRILIINELAVMGGAEIQTFREWDYFTKMGHDTYVLTFDGNVPEALSGHKLNYPIHLNWIQKVTTRVIGSKSHRRVLKKIINQISPDVIHLNNIINLPKDVFHCIKGIPVVQTIRDYGSVCPKSTCIKKDGSTCPGYLHGRCGKCFDLSIKDCYRLWILRHFNTVKKEVVDCLLSPSQALADKCSENGLPTSCLNNPFDWSKPMEKPKVIGKKKIFLYYGFIWEIKGVSKLFEAFKQFSATCDAELWLAGRVDPLYEECFKEHLKEEYVKYLGVLPYQEIMDMYHKIYCVIVPSLWLENYPNTVLEAIANKTLVIGSNRGGIPELIQNDKFCFDILDQHAFVECLKTSFELSPEEYQCVVEKAYQRIKENNTQEKYYERLMEIYHSLMNVKKQAKNTN